MSTYVQTSTETSPFALLTLSYLHIGHLLIEHPHLCTNVIPLLFFIQGPIVPHQKTEGWMEQPNVIWSSNPSLLLTVGGKAVATLRITCSYNKHIVWDGLEGEEKISQVNTKHTHIRTLHSRSLTTPSNVLSTMISLNKPKQEDVFTSSRNTCNVFIPQKTYMRRRLDTQASSKLHHHSPFHT